MLPGQPPINRLPGGLLSFLGIKNGGRTPQVLSEQLAPTFSLVDWYLQTNSLSLQQNGNVTAVGFNANWFTVPSGETWAVLSTMVNSQAALGAGVTIAFGGAWIRSALQVLPSPLTLMSPSFTTGAVAVAASAPAGAAVTFVPPGGVIGVYCSALVAGPVNTTLTINYVPLQL